ncbi:MAG: chromosome segregation protein SMC, partial [Caldanaerobacter sp.]
KKIEREEVFKEKGVIGLASNLVKYAPFLEGIFEFLLGRTVVVDRIETAIYLAKKYDQAFRIVTLEGEVVNVGGPITGGNWKTTNGSILSRKNEIKKLKSEIENLSRLEEGVKEEIKRIKSKIELYRSQFNDLQGKVHVTQRELESLRQDKIFIEKEMESLKEKIDDSLIEEREISKNIYYYKEEIEKGFSRLKALEAEKNRLEDLMKSFNDKNLQNKNEISSLEKQVTELKIEIAKLEEKLQNEFDNLKEKKKEFDEAVEAIKEKEGQIENIKMDVVRIEKEVEEKEKNLMLLKEEAEKSKVYFASLEEKVFEEEKSSHHDREKFLLVQQEYNALKEKIHYLEMSMQRFQMEIDNIKERLYQEYSLTLEEVKVEGKEDITKLRMEVDRLNEEIKKLGNVNLDSIEEYKQVKERYDFLKNQMEDIIKARESLLRVIDETGKIMRVRFKDGFEVLNAQFKETFKKLFGGGNAELVLTDEKNLLTTGVEIKAQPPGKKLQNLSLLSGGEKALVAISLLFAMLTMKPTPFCVLDEIDAALDEANVDRFARALKELSEETQFIVVTHRRGTMAVADAIYGVTMQEKG